MLEHRASKKYKTTMPFTREMQKALVEGRKKKTTRYSEYKVSQDMFYFVDDDGDKYEVHFCTGNVEKCRLCESVERYWKEEGFDSPEDMIALWKKIHPRRGYHALDKVYVHDIHILDIQLVGGIVKKPTLAMASDCVLEMLSEEDEEDVR